MNTKYIGTQISSGIIVGLSAIVNTVAQGTLLFSSAPNFIAIGITTALVTGFVVAVGSCFFKEKTLCMGTDPGTVSVIFGSVLVIDYMSMPGHVAHATVLALFLLLAISASLVFFLIAKLNLYNYVMFIPFSVTAGLLASTGWLILSGGLRITDGLSLSVLGMEGFINDPFRPGLVVALLIGFGLLELSKKISIGILLPLVVFVATIAINIFFEFDFCADNVSLCDKSLWFFNSVLTSPVAPVWQLDFASVDVGLIISKIPSILMVCFIATIIFLLNTSSLEQSYKKDFGYNQILKIHTRTSLISALGGGFFGIVLTARTILHKSTGGGLLSSMIIAGMLLLVLLGERILLMFVPKAIMGGVLIYLGLSLLKSWFWDQRKVLNKIELAEILFILITVANFGYIYGFLLGIGLACISFSIACSRSSITRLQTNISLFSSSVVRNAHQRVVLNEWGQHSIVFKLTGHIFFGSARKIEEAFEKFDNQTIQNVLIDFSDVLGIDRSAVRIFQRMLRRGKISESHFHFVHSDKNINIIKAIATEMGAGFKVSYYPNLDLGTEAVEDAIIQAHEPENNSINPFDFIESASEQNALIDHCQLISHNASEIICKEGDRSTQLFFLKEGLLEITKMDAGNEVRLAKVSSGALIGEMAFYTGDTRSATIKTVSASKLYVLDSNSLEQLRNRYPQVAAQVDLFVIKKLAGALGRANKIISSSK
jgi:sulfate permease, SulP family